ncbi:MAG TPA: ABC transporter substrate-binding protein/permease [Candidatus Limnocylindria bacterium]|nr:ABC transporter substrate-binding protein/permease [Candidatus Limnocylindria bacterium]
MERTRSAPEQHRRLRAEPGARDASAIRSAPRPFIDRILPFLLGTILAAGAVRGETWDDISARGSLRWGNDAEGGAPYIYHSGTNSDQLIGFEVEFAEALSRALGVRSEFIQYNWANLVPALKQGGNFDVIIAGLERSPENLAKIALSRPYFIFGQQLVVRDDESHITRLADLAGKKVGVLAASTSQHLADAVKGAEPKVYDDNVNYFRDLELGRLDAVLTDDPIARVNLEKNPRLKVAGAPFELNSYAVGVRSDSPILLGRINTAIGQLASDGTLEHIYRRYGLWDDRQLALKQWQATQSQVGEQHSVLKEWRRYMPILLRASVTTIWVTCAGMALAVVWGLTLALVRQYGPAPSRWLAIAYIEVFRGTPLLLQLYFIYFGLAQQLNLRLSAGAAAVLTLGLNYAATEAENYRAGIQGVPRGQNEAALALGMTRGLIIRRIVLPQALRISLPSVTNDFIAMFKDSSIVSVIGLVELTKEYLIRSLDAGDYLGMGLMTAAIYFVMSYAASLGARAIERKLSHG